MPQVTRCQGIPTGYAFAPLCGSGVTGATDELDTLVAQAAKMLTKEYGRDVEIRFNSDQRSGGAWLKNKRSDFDANCEIGLCVSLRKIAPKGKNVIDFSRHEWAALPDRICINAYAASRVLRDKALATEGNVSSTHEGYAYVEHATLAGALAWLIAHIARNNISR